MAVADARDELLEEIPCLREDAKILNNIVTALIEIIKTLGEVRTSSSLNLPALQICSKSSPPAAYSITIARSVGVSTTYKTVKN